MASPAAARDVLCASAHGPRTSRLPRRCPVLGLNRKRAIEEPQGRFDPERGRATLCRQAARHRRKAHRQGSYFGVPVWLPEPVVCSLPGWPGGCAEAPGLS